MEMTEGSAKAVRPSGMSMVTARAESFSRSIGDDFAGDGADVDRLFVEGRAADAREVEHVVDQARHFASGGADAIEVATALIVEAIGVIFEEGFAEAVDAAKRRAKIVRDGVAESFELFVGLLEFVGPLAAEAGEFEVGADASEEFLGGERFGEVIVGAGVEAFDGGLFSGAG